MRVPKHWTNAHFITNGRNPNNRAGRKTLLKQERYYRLQQCVDNRWHIELDGDIFATNAFDTKCLSVVASLLGVSSGVSWALIHYFPLFAACASLSSEKYLAKKKQHRLVRLFLHKRFFEPKFVNKPFKKRKVEENLITSRSPNQNTR